MKKLFFAVLFNLVFALNHYGAESLKTSIKFATESQARELLTQEDDFTRSWSSFDIESRLHSSKATKEKLFSYIEKQVVKWKPKEEKLLLELITSIDAEIEKNGYQLNFPEEIYLLKTTAKEEGGALGYTRSTYIVLKDDLLKHTQEELKQTLVHELFHVLSRFNPEFRKEMYSLIGFTLMNEVAYPAELADFRITNPDATQVDCYINVTVNGKPVKCMMILYSKSAYESGDFFKYLNVGFLALQGDEKKSVVYDKQGQPVVYSFKEVSGFFEQVRKNTQYIIHPEEIMADNFSFALTGKKDLPDPQLVDEVKKVLKGTN